MLRWLRRSRPQGRAGLDRMVEVLQRRMEVADLYLAAMKEGAEKRAAGQPAPPQLEKKPYRDVPAACVLPPPLLAEMAALLRDNRIADVFRRTFEACATSDPDHPNVQLGEVIPFLESHDVWFPPAIRDTSSPFHGFMCLLSPARVHTLHRQLLAFDARRARDDFGMLILVDRPMLVECVKYLRDATATDQALALFYS